MYEYANQTHVLDCRPRFDKSLDPFMYKMYEYFYLKKSK